MQIKTKAGQSTGSKRAGLLTLIGLSTGIAQSFDCTVVSFSCFNSVAQSFDRADVSTDTGYSLLACVKFFADFTDTSTFDRVGCGGD